MVSVIKKHFKELLVKIKEDVKEKVQEEVKEVLWCVECRVNPGSVSRISAKKNNSAKEIPKTKEHLRKFSNEILAHVSFMRRGKRRRRMIDLL
jgi:hypothetical protein